MEKLDVEALQSLYGEACERHSVTPHQAIKAAFAKIKRHNGDSQSIRDPVVLNLILDQMTQEDFLPVEDVLVQAKNMPIDAVDVILNNTISGGNGLHVIQLLYAVGSKLRKVDLKDIAFGRLALRGLFQGGLSCQILDLSFARVRKLNMIGSFPALHTLKLDYSFPVNNLPKGCFQGMPKLARLSMCGTGVANVWTTCAALSKLPNLIELRFQKCVCCSATGQCATAAANEVPGPWIHDNLGSKTKTPFLDWSTLNATGYDSSDTLRSGLSLSEEGESSDTLRSQLSVSEEGEAGWVLSDEHSSPRQPQATNSSSGESSLGSEMDFLEEMDEGQPMDVTAEDDVNYHGDVECEAAFTLVGFDSEGPYGRSNVSTSQDDIVPEDDTEQEGPASREDEILERNSTADSEDSLESSQCPDENADVEIGNSSATSHGYSSISIPSPPSQGFVRPGYRERNSVNTPTEHEESSEDEGQEDGIATRLTGAHHAAPICTQKYYREFMLTTLPGLNVLDNALITDWEQEKARRVYVEHFEHLANNRRSNENVFKVLRRREMGGWGLEAPASPKKRLGMAVTETSTAALSRSLCAAKMASCAWPSTKTIKISNLDLSRKCKPRQFEYHPTESSYMVFGTLSGEVVVVNHESDKVVGYLQSRGPPHSILGLCWLNKDPSKLIAGSDNGSLQLYDINHMRATTVTSDQSGVRSSFVGGNQIRSSQLGNGSRMGWSPALHTYDDFKKLTSVHINSTDDYFLASGYSKDVGLYDLRTGKQLNMFANLHQQHINVVKFAHHSPFLFATSSFDTEIKMWDIRTKATKPLYAVHSSRGNVMVCFSRDDHYLLSSAVDNEVRQYLAVDGRLHLKYEIPAIGSHQNYTRSYYMNGRDYIITGSCEENLVRICCAHSGRHLRNLSLEGRGLRKSLYVQSLRGDPHRDFHFSVLVAYNLPHSRSEIVKVNMLATDLEKKFCESERQYFPVSRLGA